MSQEFEGPPKPVVMNEDPLLALRSEQMPIIQKRIAGVLDRLDIELVTNSELPQKTPIAEAAEGAFQQGSPYAFGTSSESSEKSVVSATGPQEPARAVVVDSVLDPVLATPAASPQELVPGTDVVEPKPQQIKPQRRAQKRNQMPVEADDVRLAREAKKTEEKAAKDLENERLLTAIPEGAFVLTNPSDPSIPGEKYTRKGGKIFGENNSRKNVAGDVLRIMREQGWVAIREVAPIKQTVDQPADVIVAATVEEEPLLIKKYRNEEGQLCAVKRKGDLYGYEVEGDTDPILYVYDKGQMDALSADWEEVDETTVVTSVKQEGKTEVLTAEYLLTVVADAQKFMLESPSGKGKMPYIRSGNDVYLLSREGTFDSSQPETESVLERLNKKTPWKVVLVELKEDVVQEEVTPLEKTSQEIPILDLKDVVEVQPGAFFALNVGAESMYTGKEGDIVVRRNTDGYQLLGTNGEIIGEAYDETRVRNIAKEEQWVPHVGAVTGGEQKKGPEDYGELSEGDVWVWRGTDGSERRITINNLIRVYGALVANTHDTADGMMMDDSSDKEVRVCKEANIEVLRAKLQEQGFVRERRGSRSEKDILPKTERQDDIMSQVEKLKIKVGEARLQYVTADYKEKSAWAKLRRIFGAKNISVDPNGLDARTTKESYERLLMELQEVEVAELKTGGLSGQELRDRMGGMLRYYQLDERVALANTRNQVKIEQLRFKPKEGEKTSIAQKTALELRNNIQGAAALAENIGRWYNKLPRWKKYTMAGVSLGAGALGGAAVGGGVVLIRRAMATAGLAVMGDTAIGTWQEGKREQAATEQRAAYFKTLDAHKESGTYDFELLSNFLQQDIRNLDEKFQKQKKQDFIRRSAVWGVSVAGMFGGAWLASHARDLFSGAHGVSGTGNVNQFLHDRASAPGAAASAAQASVAEAAAPASSAPMARIAETMGHPAPVNLPRVDALLRGYEVTEADGRRGLWGIIDRHLPEGMPRGDRSRVISALEKVIQEKLRTLSPEELKLVGFPTGKIGEIYAGSTIDFTKLLNAEEIQSALGEESTVSAVTTEMGEKAVQGAGKAVEVVSQSTSAPAVAEAVASQATISVPVVSPMDEAANEAVFSRLADAPMMPSDPTEAVQTALAEDAQKFTALNSPRSMAQFFAENPERKDVYVRTIGDVRKSIFLTQPLASRDGFMKGEFWVAKYDYTINRSLGVVNMSRALEAFQEMRVGAMSSYVRERYPLHPSQLESLMRLVSIAQDPKMFGSVGLPGNSETIDQYTRRIAALAAATNKERVLGALIRGRSNLLVA